MKPKHCGIGLLGRKGGSYRNLSHIIQNENFFPARIFSFFYGGDVVCPFAAVDNFRHSRTNEQSSGSEGVHPEGSVLLACCRVQLPHCFLNNRFFWEQLVRGADGRFTATCMQPLLYSVRIGNKHTWDYFIPVHIIVIAVGMLSLHDLKR